MTKFATIGLLFIAIPFTWAQGLSGEELLEKTIQYHDPHNQWQNFVGEFDVVMQYADTTKRQSSITLDFPASRFSLEAKQGDDTYSYKLTKDSCTIVLNGSTDISKENRTKYRLSCERAKMYKDYYSYLYGLPMKLKDPGTQIDPVVTKTNFKGKDYLRLKVTYDAEVGEDTWYFYFDPITYAMEVYQFFHEEEKNDGEYILLSGLETINGIKMPKIRAWYYNKADKFLGTDVLETGR